MSVKTGSVKERRTVRYESLDELLAEAEALTGTNFKLSGNWTLGQILKHIALVLEASIDGGLAPVPVPIKIVAKLLMRNKFLNGSIPAGFKIPSSGRDKFEPSADVTTEDALEHLRRGVERCKSEDKRAPHPVFGDLTPDEWNRFNLRHAELHLSFVIPDQA